MTTFAPRLAATALLATLAFGAQAQTKEVTIAHQDMVVPWRYAQVTGEIEKSTGYKINFRKFAGGGDVIRAMASGQVQIGEAGSAPVASALSQGLPVELGFLLGTRNYSCNVDRFPAGSTLLIHANRSLQDDNGMCVFECRLEGTGILVEARLNVFQPRDVSTYIQEPPITQEPSQ